MMDRVDDVDTTTTDAPTCGECGGDATGGAYAPNRPGMFLCRNCHTDPDNGRKPAGDAAGGHQVEDAA